MANGKVIKVSGPLVVAGGLADANMFDVVRVGPDRLIGEVIEMRGDQASIQVYEETSGLGPGAEVLTTGAPLSVELGPGLISTIYDGIQRPLEAIRQAAGSSITRGINIPALDRDAKWDFEPCVEAGASVQGGDIIGGVQETPSIYTKIMIPPRSSGVIKSIKAGSFTVMEPIGELETEKGLEPLYLMQSWPVRIGRPYKTKLSPDVPMVTGQRNIDTLFPIARGGTAAIPGPFGSGKTVTQHQIAKWSDVDLVVYIGCGERGNEMTDVLREFPELVDPRTGESIMKRTVLIANTSDMPVAAREASIYTGITIAEFYRDMGYSVAVLADSTSRWAEALREMSGRLEEMPGEEGYPAYLTSRLAQFYERAGRVICVGSDGREGSLSAIGAVSPPGGDTSEPVSQATLRIVKVFWGLDAALAYARHFPAINWMTSYSLYEDRLKDWFRVNIAQDQPEFRAQALSLLQKEAELNEIVQLVGVDSLSAQDRLVLEVSRSLREDFLQQDAMSDTDSYCSSDKQYALLKLILCYYSEAGRGLSAGADMNKVFSISALGDIGRAKHEADYKTAYPEIEKKLRLEIDALIKEGSAQ